MTNSEFQQAIVDHPTNKSDAFGNEHMLLPGNVRKKLGLNCEAMAKLFGMSEVGYRGWEMGSRRPGGPALRLLALLDAQPQKVLGWLQAL